MLQEDDLGFKCEDKIFSVPRETDTLVFKVNKCDAITFMDRDSHFNVKFIGKYQDKTFNQMIKYPAVSTQLKWKGNELYSLREVQDVQELRMPLNTKF